MMHVVFALGCQPVNGLDLIEDAGGAGTVFVEDTGTEGMAGQPAPRFPFDSQEILNISLDLPPASVDGLVHFGDYVPGTFHLDDRQSEVGVRLKGSSTFDTLKKKPSFKLAFDAFTPGNRFLKLEHLTLNAMKYDKTMMREAVAYHLLGMTDVPSPRHAFASLTINGEPYGVYSVIETLDNHWLKRVLPDDPDGNLYDTLYTTSDLTDAGLSSFSQQEGDEATAGADLEQLVKDLDAGSILDVLNTRFATDAVLDYLAFDLATGNYDGYSRNTNNYLLYHAPLADRWYFVPWGQDTAFGGQGPLFMAVRARVTSRCHDDSDCRELLLQHVRSLLDTWESQDLLGWATERAALIGPACEADPRKSSKCDQQGILDKIEDRPEEIRREIGP
jgi:hypothetical protein